MDSSFRHEMARVIFSLALALHVSQYTRVPPHKHCKDFWERQFLSHSEYPPSLFPRALAAAMDRAACKCLQSVYFPDAAEPPSTIQSGLCSATEF